VLRQRCSACHAVPTPGSMTYDMWMMQIDRMRGVFAQRGLPWLTPAEREALQVYLHAHAGTA
jgi:hypothetical protein